MGVKVHHLVNVGSRRSLRVDQVQGTSEIFMLFHSEFRRAVHARKKKFVLAILELDEHRFQRVTFKVPLLLAWEPRWYDQGYFTPSQ